MKRMLIGKAVEPLVEKALATAIQRSLDVNKLFLDVPEDQPILTMANPKVVDVEDNPQIPPIALVENFPFPPNSLEGNPLLS